MNKKTRPTSVTVISWILIVLAAIALISNTIMFLMNDPMTKQLMEQSPMPIIMQYIITYIGLIVMYISGIGMLQGKNWARFLYIIWSAIGSLIGLAIAPMKTVMIPGIVVFIVIVIFLTRPKVNKYFNPA